LKNSIFLEIAEIWGIENVYEKRERRLLGFLLQSFFGHFLASEFFQQPQSLTLKTAPIDDGNESEDKSTRNSLFRRILPVTA